MKDHLLSKVSGTALALLALAGSLNPTAMAGTPKAPSAAGEKIPVILDMDIGDDIDDTWALVLALRCPELDLKLVVGDYGRREYRAKLIGKLLETAGRTDIPLGIGPNNGPEGNSRQQEWVADYDLKKYPGKVYEDGVQAIIDTIMNSPTPITVISIGPLPNIQEALEREPKIAKKANFVGMYGSVRKGYKGKDEISPEWNVKANAKACQVALSADWDITITPLDTCGIVALDGSNYATIRNCEDPLIQTLMENYHIWWKNQEHRNKGGDTTRPFLRSSILYDLVAVYLAFSQELCKMETLSIRVDDKGFTRIDPKGKAMSVATEWKDLSKFEDFLVERLTKAAPADGEVFQANFNKPEGMKEKLAGLGKIVENGYQGTPSLLLENDNPEKRKAESSFKIPVEKIAGQVVDFRAMIKAENVRPIGSGLRAGIGFMLSLKTDHGTIYRRIPHVWHALPNGSFDWKPVEHVMRVPANVREARLAVGLTNATGKIWIDNLELKITKPTVGTSPAKKPFIGHEDVPRLRGVMIGDCSDEDLRELAQDWEVNQVRIPLSLEGKEKQASRKTAPSLAEYDQWLDGRLEYLDEKIDSCGRYGLKALPSLHYTPGGRTEKGLYQRLFQEAKYQEKYIQVWERIARRYKGNKAVYAYDILNEPLWAAKKPGLLDWPELATKTIKAIRAIDPGKPIVFELGPWGKCLAYDNFQPLHLDRVIYSYHLYQPHTFTHQGVCKRNVEHVYPGVIDGELWNKERLRETMLPAIEFQKRHNVQIYVGEFSATRFAPENSTYRWLRDVIELFEENKWDWTYHAYREWDGWSVEHGTDRNEHKPSPMPTDRQKLLMSWFANNILQQATAY